jgi:hypothetical protein
LQVPSAQHGAPGAPQATHVVEEEQTSPAPRQVDVVAVPTGGQHASPEVCPQLAQDPFTQRVPGAVHSDPTEPELALQHG